MNAFDRFMLAIAPAWTLRRIQARSAAQVLARHFEAAQPGRRTSGWKRSRGDANAVLTSGIPELRMHARDLLRNNSWAKRGQSVIANNVTGWGIIPKAAGLRPRDNETAMGLWNAWASSTIVDVEGRQNFQSLQHQVMRAIVSDGEVLLRRFRPKVESLKTIPLSIGVMECDFIDTNKDGELGPSGGPIVQGIEYDRNRKRVAYWLYPEHPGSNQSVGAGSQRVDAEEILHIFYQDRPAQARGISWLGTAITNLKDFDEFEDAELMKQKIAACFAAFKSNTDGSSTALGEEDADDASIETLEPGMIMQLKPGEEISFGTPPQPNTDNFAARQLRRVAAGLGITYEDLTGDYSQVNFSSARMARLSHQANIRNWQYNMLIPQFCAGVWRWAMEQVVQMGAVSEAPPAEWTVPPLPMIEPDKEGLAYQRLVRVGAMTPSEMVREQGGDPELHWKEYAADMVRLDELKIKLDSDVRAVSQAGQVQNVNGQAPEAKPPEKTDSESEPERSIDEDLPLSLRDFQ